MKDLSLVYPKPDSRWSIDSHRYAKNEVLRQLETGIPMENTAGYYTNGRHGFVRVYSGEPGWFDVGLSVERLRNGNITSCQRLKRTNDLVIKNNYIHRDGKEFCSSVQIQDKASGSYSVTRMKEGKVVGGYEVHPVERKLMKGFKGKVETLAMKIGTNSNGCERPVLRRVSEFMLNTLRKVK